VYRSLVRKSEEKGQLERHSEDERIILKINLKNGSKPSYKFMHVSVSLDFMTHFCL
jgi:hypothetical protein